MSLKNSLLNLNIANEMYQTTLEHDLSPPQVRQDIKIWKYHFLTMGSHCYLGATKIWSIGHLGVNEFNWLNVSKNRITV